MTEKELVSKTTSLMMIHLLRETKNTEFCNDIFEIAPYCSCGDDYCKYCGHSQASLFFHNKTGVEASWIKNPLKNLNMSEYVSVREILDIWIDCIESLKKD